MSKIVIGLCTFVMLVITPSVHADPIVITSGSLTVVGISGSPVYSISGQNFSVTSTGGSAGGTPNCLPCPAGATVSLSSFLSGSSLGQGTATINGTMFTNVGFFGQFSFGASAILPVAQENITISVPFTFSGNISGCEGSSLVCTTVLFSSVELVGQGTATASFIFSGTQNGVPLFSFRSITYEFREIPEPMTVTLLASGLIGLGATLRSRRKRL